MKLIVGLGNPGLSYVNARHNLGARAVKTIAKRYKIKFRLNRSLKSRIAEIDIRGKQCLLALPDTFMNISGEAIKLLLKKWNIAIPDLLIIHDDMDLELGSVRFRKKGSSGGHKGISSIIKMLNTEEFNRLKLGIGRAAESGNASDYVLSSFSKPEAKILTNLLVYVVKAVEVWVRCGIYKAMNEFN